ncbi:hypothetical protein ACGFYP_18300 [Streptomyces sp. NPDC048370]|uniref:hypothetical protein n=1 Tax=Streptomyces sp. NPDC048370 TaxID=3365540 RepID=UPI003721919A
MNEELRRFISVYLQQEVAYDDLSATRETLEHFKPEWKAAVREGLLSVLNEKQLTAEEYESLTAIEFETDDALHAYLQDVYDFLFAGSEKQPAPPED